MGCRITGRLRSFPVNPLNILFGLPPSWVKHPSNDKAELRPSSFLLLPSSSHTDSRAIRQRILIEKWGRFNLAIGTTKVQNAIKNVEKSHREIERDHLLPATIDHYGNFRWKATVASWFLRNQSKRLLGFQGQNNSKRSCKQIIQIVCTLRTNYKGVVRGEKKI